jgi:hypothetical protein
MIESVQSLFTNFNNQDNLSGLYAGTSIKLPHK